MCERVFFWKGITVHPTKYAKHSKRIFKYFVCYTVVGNLNFEYFYQSDKKYTKAIFITFSFVSFISPAVRGKMWADW